MSYVPSKAMKHAHVAPAAEEPSAAGRARAAVEHRPPPLWTMIAAGVAGAVATALIFSLRSSAPAPAKRPAARRKPQARRRKSD